MQPPGLSSIYPAEVHPPRSSSATLRALAYPAGARSIASECTLPYPAKQHLFYRTALRSSARGPGRETYIKYLSPGTQKIKEAQEGKQSGRHVFNERKREKRREKRPSGLGASRAQATLPIHQGARRRARYPPDTGWLGPRLEDP